MVGNDAGDVFLVWLNHDGEYYAPSTADVWANRYQAGQGWGVAETLAIGGSVVEATALQVAIDQAGNALLTWLRYDGEKDYRLSVWTNAYIVGQGWGESQTVGAEPGGMVSPHRMAMDDSGNAMMVWHKREYDHDTSRVYERVWASRYTLGQGWSQPEMINADDASSLATPRVAVDPNGNAYAVWTRWDADGSHVYANRYTPTQGWGVQEKVGDHVSSGFYNGVGAEITVSSDGSALVSWHTEVVSTGFLHVDLMSSVYTPGQGWGAAELVAKTALQSHIIAKANGEFWTFLWEDGLSGQYSVRDVATNTIDQVPLYEQPSPPSNIVANRTGDVWVLQGSGLGGFNTYHYTPGQGWGVAEHIKTSTMDTTEVNPLALATDPAMNAQ